jgi:vacuolar protein sorting-associated protein 29
MVLVLCIGDLHVPHRAADLPPKFKELLKPGKVDTVLCAGNLCTGSTLDYLRGVCPDVRTVAGDFDDGTPGDAPETLVRFFVCVCVGGAGGVFAGGAL